MWGMCMPIFKSLARLVREENEVKDGQTYNEFLGLTWLTSLAKLGLKFGRERSNLGDDHKSTNK